MRKFGLELRQLNSIGTKSLFDDVDTVLSKYNIPSGSVSSNVQIQTIAHSLQKMMKVDSHFSVCTVRDCAKICQICIASERMNVYSAAHCIHWNEMTDDYRQMLCAMVLDDFRSVLNEE